MNKRFAAIMATGLLLAACNATGSVTDTEGTTSSDSSVSSTMSDSSVESSMSSDSSSSIQEVEVDADGSVQVDM